MGGLFICSNTFFLKLISEKTAGEVICMDDWQEEGLRKAWGQSPDSEVLKVLEEAELQPFTQKLDPASTCDHTLTGESLIRVFFICVMCSVLLTIVSMCVSFHQKALILLNSL